MSKGLEALERLTTFCGIYTEEQAQMVCKDIDTIEKLLKSLEIIKKIIVLIDVFIESKSANDYNEFVSKSKERHLTKKEYDLLKEVLLND